MNNWSNIIQELKDGITVSVSPERWDLENPEYAKILNMWKAANFNLDVIKWTNFYPEQHFDKKIVIDQLENLNLTGIHRAWISRLDPGYMAPWHWDIDDNEQEYLKQGSITRYTVLIEPMAHGHILIIGNDHFYNKPQGTIIKWANYKEWHSGINAGMLPSYMLHLLGY